MEFPQGTETSGRGEVRGRGARGATAAAVLLAAGALNVAADGPAEARSGATWNRLAGCESGGNWRADTGNGFSGGLQFAHSTWRSFGGGKYASRASRASRAQQIRVAERVLARQGWGAWPACSARLGLRSSGARQSAPHSEARRSAPRAGTQARTNNSGRYRERLRSPRHREQRYGSDYGRHQQYKARPQRKSGGHVVNRGETVSGIAYAYGWGWQEFYRLNRQVIGANPNIIYPGTRLAVRNSRTG
ncbi:peptidoglycan-binding protein [Streptomyces sp. CB02923]|uniref:LysM peptidoglycan-binding domain-containing protein n=1 Tax=Streptomyces sp. CB02923 TaxID=1718985 RepID=UPI00093BCEB1|nr:transglycosylase family protein [Streptomyces sp. CB02923]OKH99402.1 peptidoglycan-binding protein [Streptomyces sp. CB02923]